MTNIEIVQQCYEKFKHGEGAALLALFAPQIEFRLAEGHPYRPDGRPWMGTREVAEQFLMKAGPEWERWNILIGNILEAGDAVIVECRYEAFYKPTGRPLEAQVCHVWRLEDGKVASFHQYLDTARLQKVMGYSG